MTRTNACRLSKVGQLGRVFCRAESTMDKEHDVISYPWYGKQNRHLSGLPTYVSIELAKLIPTVDVTFF